MRAVTEAQSARLDLQITAKNISQQSARDNEMVSILREMETSGTGTFVRCEALKAASDDGRRLIQCSLPDVNVVAVQQQSFRGSGPRQVRHRHLCWLQFRILCNHEMPCSEQLRLA